MVVAKRGFYYESIADTYGGVRDRITDTLDTIDVNTAAEISVLEGTVLSLVEIALPPGQQLDRLKDQIKAAINRMRISVSNDTQDTVITFAASIGIDLSELPKGIDESQVMKFTSRLVRDTMEPPVQEETLTT